MNAVSFCLYGTDAKYLHGMLANAWLMPRVYPGWECHIWTDNALPELGIHRTLQRLGCILHPMDLGWRQRMFYRFLIHDVPGVDRYLIRDADSRISMRERRCVDQWIASGKILHTIHDHPYHIRPIQGGMFGVWRGAHPSSPMREVIGNVWPMADTWGRDEEFLEHVIWPLLSFSVCEHGRINPIPPSDEDDDPQAFVGEIYESNGKPAHPEHRAMRLK